MNMKLIRWRLALAHSGRLSETLRPLRSQQEVGAILGCSAELVAQIERSALRKIIYALINLETEEPETTMQL